MEGFMNLHFSILWNIYLYLVGYVWFGRILQR